jgi:hypothetical protein
MSTTAMIAVGEGVEVFKSLAEAGFYLVSAYALLRVRKAVKRSQGKKQD